MWGSRLFWSLLLTWLPVSATVVLAVGLLVIRWTGTSAEPQAASASEPPVLAASLAIGAVLLVFNYWLSRRIVLPIRALTRAADALRSGDYEASLHVRNRDEIGQLASAFNRMRTEMASRENQLREANQVLSAVLEGMRDGVIAVDDRERVLFANDAAGSLMGFRAGDARGRLLLETVRNHRLREAVVELLSNPRQRHLQLEITDAQDSLTLSVNATVLSPESGVVMVFHNLTEHRQLQSMRRDFVANVSHELKTPLSSIKAYAETLSNGAINDPQHRDRFVEQIEEQADRLHRLIVDLLSLSRIESGREHLELHPVDLPSLVGCCLRDQQPAADMKQIRLLVRDDLPQARVRADEDGLRQILNNLIDNAIKYTPPGGTVTVGWQVQGTMISIAVEDTGIGIPPPLQARIFERFFRVDKARSRELGGTGLGLAIVKHLAQGFGGTVSVRSQPDQGSCFLVELPAA
jgi:two-component system phosphate regulon sensor histidine kinase PhoR